MTTSERTNKAVHTAVTEMRKSVKALQAYVAQVRKTEAAIDKSLTLINKEWMASA